MDREARPIFDSTIYEYVKSINAWSEPNEFHLMSYAIWMSLKHYIWIC